MSSQPPSRPPGLTLLNLEAIQSAEQSTLTPSASSGSEIAITPDSRQYGSAEHASFSSPRGFFSSAPKGWTTARGLIKSSSTDMGGEPRLPSSPSLDFFRLKHPPEKTKTKEKEKGKSAKKREKKLAISYFKADVKIKEYPAGYRGFLEAQGEKFGFNERLRAVLGVNSFADGMSTGLFSLELMALDLEKPLISNAGKARIKNTTKAVTKKELLDALCLYDRSMSFWLQDQECYSFYVNHMQQIFSDKKRRDVRLIFGSIQKYSQLDKRIKKVVEEEPYNEIYANIIGALRKYKQIFPKKFQINGVEIDFLSREKAVEKEGSHIKGEARKGMRSLSMMELCLEERFQRPFDLEDDFFDVFLELRNENSGKVPDCITEALPKCLPKLDFEHFCQKDILELCLYFFAALCRWNPKFYEVIPGSKKEDVYINKDFISELKAIDTVEKFVLFLQERKMSHDQGLLKIVLQKTLECVRENGRIEIECHQVIAEIFEMHENTLSSFDALSFYDYGELFFTAVIADVFKRIENALPQGPGQPPGMLSAPAPKL